MEKLIKYNILSDDKIFIKDWFTSAEEGVIPSTYWTSDLVKDGFYSAQYQGCTVDQVSKECTGGIWVEVGAPAEPDYVAVAKVKKASLLREADGQISILQDASDLGIATDAEELKLVEWKTYRVLVSRIDPLLGVDIEWPTPPTA